MVSKFKGTETCGHAMIGKGTPLKTSMKQQLAITAPTPKKHHKCSAH